MVLQPALHIRSALVHTCNGTCRRNVSGIDYLSPQRSQAIPQYWCGTTLTLDFAPKHNMLRASTKMPTLPPSGLFYLFN